MLKKLSLAALVAMGSMSLASATPLTEAIKNVNLNGFMRVRFYNETPDKGNGYNRWRTNAKLVFSMPVAENLSLVWRISDQTDVRNGADSVRGYGATPTAKQVNSAVNPSITDNLFFLKYSADGLNAIAGKIPVSTPITSADSFSTAHGAGIIAAYNIPEVNGLTVAAGWVDALNNAVAAVKNSSGKLVTTDNPSDYVGSTLSNDIYTAAAIYANKAFGDAQVWYFYATHLIDYEFVGRLNLNLLQKYGVDLHIDGAVSNLDDSVAAALGNKGDDSHTYYNVSTEFNTAKYIKIPLDVKIGWAQTNDKVGVVTTSADAPIDAVGTTDQRYAIANLTDAAMLYGKIGYIVNAKTNVYVSAANIHDQAKENSGEYEAGGTYKVNKKFSLNAYYSYLDYSSDAESKGFVDNQEIRVQALYKF